MPEEAEIECTTDESDITGPADEVGRALGDDRRPEDEKSKLPVGSGKLPVADGKTPDDRPVSDERMPVGPGATPDGAII